MEDRRMALYDVLEVAMMPRITPADCAGCPALTKCTAHITGGTWDHRKGVDPCISTPAATERKSEGSEQGYAQRFSLREGK